MSQKVGVVGGGSFGHALAGALAKGGAETLLWSRRGGSAAAAGVEPTMELERLASTELIYIVVPSMYVPDIAPELGRHLDGRHLLVHVSRGLLGEELETVSRFLSSSTPCRRVGCLAGPINPKVLAEGEPGGGIVGSLFPEVADAVRESLEGAALRLYETDDLVGVEVASALVGLLAMAAGFCLEAKVSSAAFAVMMNRGLSEAARVGVKLGAREETFHGMAGAGDLFAAVAGDERAEVRLGRALARESDLERAGREAGAHIEGLSIARRVASYAERVGIEAPIAAAIATVLDGEVSPDIALGRLMAR